MKKTFLFLVLIVLNTSLIAQVNLDSLWGVWNDKTAPDTSRAQAMKNIAWDGYLFSQPDSAFYFAQLMYEFANKKGLNKKMVSALNIQGLSYSFRGDYHEALAYFKRCLMISEEISYKQGKTSSLINIGNIYRNQGDYPKAIVFLQRSLKISEQISDRKGIANTLNNIGLIYGKQGEYSKALNYFMKSLKISEDISNKRGMAGSLNNIGIIYKNLDDDSKAMEYHQRCLKIFKEISDIRGVANTLNNIGLVYKNQGDYSKAKDFFQRCLKISERISFKQGIALSLNNIGNIYNNKDQYTQAIIWCEKGFAIAKEIHILAEQKNACLCLYDAYKSMGNGDKALEYYEYISMLEDSLQAKETSKKLHQMEFQKKIMADSLAKEEEKLKVRYAHELEIQRKNRNRNMFIASGLFVVIITLGLFFQLRHIRISKTSIEKEKDRSDNLLLNILPAEIAEELKEKGRSDARDFDMISILFTDFYEFTKISAGLSAHELVTEINSCYEAFDQIIGKYGIEKIKTIGDSYMAAGGLPVPSNDSVVKTVQVAIEMQAYISERKKEKTAKDESFFEMRVGIHTGPVVAGIVGVKKFQYDVWGDTVNTASRMEELGEVEKVNISHDTYALIKDNPLFTFESRGKIEVIGKGEMEMYYVSRNFSEG